MSLADRLPRNQEAQRETDTAGHPLTFKRVIKHTVDGKGQAVEVEIVSPEENPLISQEMKLWRELRAFIGLTGITGIETGPCGSCSDRKIGSVVGKRSTSRKPDPALNWAELSTQRAGRVGAGKMR